MPPGYQPYNSMPAMNYSSWGARVWGYIVNGLSLTVFMVPMIIAIAAGPTQARECTVNDEVQSCDLPTAAGWGIIVATGLLGLAVFFVLYSKAVGTTGQFWGHRAANVRIVNALDGSPIGAGKAFGRWWAHYLDSLPCYLGFLWPLWDEKKQTFADKICGTVSIRA